MKNQNPIKPEPELQTRGYPMYFNMNRECLEFAQNNEIYVKNKEIRSKYLDFCTETSLLVAKIPQFYTFKSKIFKHEIPLVFVLLHVCHFVYEDPMVRQIGNNCPQ